MDMVAKKPSAPVGINIYHRPCAFNPTGVAREICQRTTRVLQRNLSGCCASRCTSKERVCYECLKEGVREPSPVSSAASGLCKKHAGEEDEAAVVREPRRASPPAVTKVPAPSPVSSKAPQVFTRVVATTQPASRSTPVPARAAASVPAPRVHTGEVLSPARDLKTEEPAWKATIARIQKAMAEAEYAKVDPARIRPMPGQPREYFDEVDLQGLSRSIVEVGQFQPGIIRRVSGDVRHDYEILDGERRWRSVILGSVSFYKAMIVKIDDEAAPFVVASIANFNRAGHTHMELSNAIERLHNGSLKIPIEEIAKMYRISVHWAHQLHGLQNLHPQIRGLIDPRRKREELLPVNAAIQVSKLEPSVQMQLVEKFRSKQVTLNGLRREALAIAAKTGTYIRQRHADEPARKLGSVRRISGVVARSATDLKAGLLESGMREILLHNPAAVAEMRASIAAAKRDLEEIRKILG